MDVHALKRLEDRARTLEGVSPILGTGNRDNEPCEAWAPDDPRAVDALLERGAWSRSATVLNLDTCRGIGGAERPDVITGLDGLAIEADPAGAAAIGRRIRAEHGDTPGPREVATELLGLDKQQAAVLFDGPNWSGKARAWVQPHEAAQAIQHVRRDLPAEQVWAHLDRRAIVEQHAREQPDAYLDREARARVEHWVSRVADGGHDPETGVPAHSITGADLVAERQIVLEQLRSEQAWDSIAATAEIDPTARIGSGVSIGEYASIGRDAEIGDHVSIGQGASVGDDSRVAAGVSLADQVVIGDRTSVSVSVGQGTLVGDDCVLARRDDSLPLGGHHPPDAAEFSYIPGDSRIPDRHVLGRPEPEPDLLSGLPEADVPSGHRRTPGSELAPPRAAPPLAAGAAFEKAGRGRGGRPL